MEIENDVQLANIIEISIQNLDNKLNDLKSKKLIVIWINNHDKIQRGKSLINNSLSMPIHKIASLEISSQNQLSNLLNLLLSLFGSWVLRVPLGKSSFSLSINQEKCMNHFYVSIYKWQRKFKFKTKNPLRFLINRLKRPFKRPEREKDPIKRRPKESFKRSPGLPTWVNFRQRFSPLPSFSRRELLNQLAKVRQFW